MNKNISLKKFLIILSLLLIIEIGLLYFFKANNKAKISAKEYQEHCGLAVCNESKTICFNYDVDSEGKTVVTWKGSCAK